MVRVHALASRGKRRTTALTTNKTKRARGCEAGRAWRVYRLSPDMPEGRTAKIAIRVGILCKF